MDNREAEVSIREANSALLSPERATAWRISAATARTSATPKGVAQRPPVVALSVVDLPTRR
ncbi:MAG: hypothetical protein ACRDWI_00230 [Jiangellaceae bacterium]